MWKQLVKSLLKIFGYEIRPFSAHRDAFHDQQMLLRDIQVQTIFDVGGHFGETVITYKRLFPDATIYSFEPFPEFYKQLCRRFKGDSSVKPIRLAVSDKVGTSEFHVTKRGVTSSLLPRPTSDRRYWKLYDTITTKTEVPVTTLDDFCKEKAIGEIHLLKMDIQGAELSALRGATESLNQASIGLIYSETYFVPHYEGHPMFYELCDFLAEYGYTLFGIYNTNHARNGQLRFGDVIFVSPQIRTGVLDTFEPEP